MNILINSYLGYGAWFALRLLEEGHNVDYYLSDRKYVNVLKGLIPPPLSVTPNYGLYDLSIFDLTGKPKAAEKSAKLVPTIGDGNLHCQLEEDRAFGIELMEDCDINVPFWEQFDDINEAKKFIQKTGKRYVFKPDGGQNQDAATTYVSESADDLLAYLDKIGNATKGADFILQEVVEGIECSTEGWFNGEDFFFINGTLEEKKFMNDNKGPNTGCSGNLVWEYGYEAKIYVEGLSRIKDFLKESGFRGMIDLNTIIGDKLYGLEWTPRFGYDASSTLLNLINSNVGDFIGAIASGAKPDYETSEKYGAAIRLSIPPYPTELEGAARDGVSISGIFPDDVRRIYLYDALVSEEGNLETAGINGFIAVPLGKGATPREAFSFVDYQCSNIKIPDMQYRTDIEHSVMERYNKLRNMGWL